MIEVRTSDSFAQIAKGVVLPSLDVMITRADLVRYAGAADDYVAQHWDQPMMLAAGFDDVVVHGWLCFAHMCRCVTNWAVPTVATIDSYRIRYLRPLYPGPVSCGGLVENVHGDRAELGLWATNMAGEKVTIADMVLRPTS
jgi:acyl dehydratase